MAMLGILVRPVNDAWQTVAGQAGACLLSAGKPAGKRRLTLARGSAGNQPFNADTGAVIVVSGSLSCIAIWLPRRLTSVNPCLASIEQVSRPDSVRSLPNRDLNLRDENLAMQTLPHLLLRGAFEKQLERLAQVVTRFLDGPALAGDIQLQRNRFPHAR